MCVVLFSCAHNLSFRYSGEYKGRLTPSRLLTSQGASPAGAAAPSVRGAASMDNLHRLDTTRKTTASTALASTTREGSRAEVSLTKV